MLIFIAVFIALLALLLFMPVRAIVMYESQKAGLIIKFGPFKLKGKKRAPKKNGAGEEKDKKPEEKKPYDRILNLIGALYETSGTIKRAIRVESLKLNSRFGSGDAAATGFLVGIAYAEIYKFIGLISCVFTVKPPVITIEPDYGDEPVFNADFRTVIKTNAAKAIYTAVKFYKKYKSYE